MLLILFNKNSPYRIKLYNKSSSYKLAASKIRNYITLFAMHTKLTIVHELPYDDQLKALSINSKYLLRKALLGQHFCLSNGGSGTKKTKKLKR